MARKRSLSNWILRLACALLCLTLLTTYWSAGLFARYTSSDAGEDSGRVAAFVFDVTDTHNHMLALTEITQPGDSVTYKFTVSNTRNSIISKVAETYQLTLELDGSLPLECSLTGADNAQLIHAGTYSGSAHNFSTSVTESTDYTLTVTWPDEPDDNKDIAFSRAGLAHLLISISAQQAD